MRVAYNSHAVADLNQDYVQCYGTVNGMIYVFRKFEALRYVQSGILLADEYSPTLKIFEGGLNSNSLMRTYRPEEVHEEIFAKITDEPGHPLSNAV